MKRKTQRTSTTFDKSKNLLSASSGFAMQEAYKTLRTNVAFSLPGDRSRCIGIISANRSEGKSTISLNLAISLAQIEKKVIIIDCDMRLPTVASKLGMTKGRLGLSDYLTGDNGFEDLPIIRNSELGIDIIPAGTIPPDPTKLIESPQMSNLLNILKEIYDYVIVDFPPVGMVSDAAILSSVIDGYLIVVRHESSELSELDETIRQMNFANANIMGFVYNDKPSTKKFYKKNSKYYYYEYKK